MKNIVKNTPTRVRDLEKHLRDHQEFSDRIDHEWTPELDQLSELEQIQQMYIQHHKGFSVAVLAFNALHLEALRYAVKICQKYGHEFFISAESPEWGGHVTFNIIYQKS